MRLREIHFEQFDAAEDYANRLGRLSRLKGKRRLYTVKSHKSQACRSAVGARVTYFTVETFTGKLAGLDYEKGYFVG